MRKLVIALAVAAGFSTVALAAGIATTGFPTVQPAGTTGSVTVNGVTIPQGNYTTLPLTGSETIPADTNLSSGRTPQTESITVDQLLSYFRAPQAITSAASLTFDATLANVFTFTLGANHTLTTPSNLSSGQMFKLIFTQDTTGSRVLTTLNIPIWKWYVSRNGLERTAGQNISGTAGVLLTTTASAVDVADCVYNGTFIMCGMQQDHVTGNGGRPTSL